jgi:hypothetical protein
MFNLLKQARAAIPLLSADEIRNHAESPVHIGLVADGSNAYAEMEEYLVPALLPRNEWRQRMSQVYRANDSNVPAKVDIVLYEPGLPCPPGAYTFQRGDPDATVAEILQDNPDRDLALGRQFPAFRRAVVDRIVQMAARENAIFVIATALPNVVPSLLELPWAVGEFVSDTTFLTTNQIRMAFQVAAACGKPVGFSAQKAAVLSIAAGSLGWRALARELVSHIPLGGGLIPKGAIAYAGTYVVGKGLEFLLVHDGKPSDAQREQLYHEGLERGRSFARTLRMGAKRA